MGYLEKYFLGIIPARGGSKRLPSKNTRILAGKPLLNWTIEAALQSRFLDAAVVSTDDERIADVAAEAGLPVPFMRPAELATDTATTFSAIQHALMQWEAEFNKAVDYIVILQPTSPLRTAEHIDQAIALTLERGAKGLASVCPVEHPPEWMNVLPADDSLENFLHPGAVGKRSQDFPQRYRLNGAVIVMAADAVRHGIEFWDLKKTYAYRMDPMDSVDIDSELDFMLAETILRQRGYA